MELESELAFRLRQQHSKTTTSMGKRKRNRRPWRPRKEAPARTSSPIAAARTGGGARTPVAPSAGAHDPSPGHIKKRGDIGPPQVWKRGGGRLPLPHGQEEGGGKPPPPSRHKRGGAANRHAPKITTTAILYPFSAALTHGIIDVSTPGKRGCVGPGDQGAGALRMARRGPHH